MENFYNLGPSALSPYHCAKLTTAMFNDKRTIRILLQNVLRGMTVTINALNE